MTLERHRSKLIPDVDFGGDGRVFVTDTDGTFPMRGGKRGKERVPPVDYDDVKSYRSFDPKRDQKRISGRYKQKESSRYGQEINDLSGTVGSKGSASLQRKLRKLKGREDAYDRHPSSWDYDADHPAKRFGTIGTWSSIGKRKRKSQAQKGYPRVDGYKGSLGRGTTKSLDLASIKAYKEKMKGRNNSMLEIYATKTTGGKMPLIPELPVRNRRLVDERLPGVFFIIGGLILTILGAVKIVLSYWHSYYCATWTGLLMLVMGIIGTTHKGDYLTKWKNGLYIVFGILSSAAVMITCALLLKTLIPMITQLAEGITEADITNSDLASFTNMNKSLAIVMDSVETMFWITLGVDLASFALCLVNFFTLTATMVSIGNHWEAVYLTTGTCDHRGHPQFFNPFEQISLAQATILMGAIVIVSWNTGDFDHYWAPVWASAMILVAAVLSLFQGKRIDLQALGMFAMCMQVGAIMGLTFAAVYSLLGLTEDIDKLQPDGNRGELLYGQLIVSAVAKGIFVFFVFINIIFIIGVLFRQCQTICCVRCIDVHKGSRA